MCSALKYILYVAIAVLLRYDQQHRVSAEKVRVIELTSRWSLRNTNGSIVVEELRLPSGVYTALSELYGDVLYSKNDVELRWISKENWIYARDFMVNQADFDNVRSVNLTLHGIDTIATIRLNDVLIGRTNNMFVRYSFDVLPYLKLNNTLEIEFTSPVAAAQSLSDYLTAQSLHSPPDCPVPAETGECHRNMLRKMQTSFGGKWNLAAPSMGIWQTIVLEYYEVAIMRDIDIALQKNASHWIMDIRAFLSTGVPENFYCELSFFAPDLLADQVTMQDDSLSAAKNTIEFQVAIPKDSVLLWWPNGYGAQKLYPLYFYTNCWLDPDGPQLRSRSISQKSLRIGFRTIELVEDRDDSGRTFYFKVNDVPIFMKGANYFPAHILPELSYNTDNLKHLLQSAQEAHMNMIRVWGGGLYESDYFYNLADYYGLLVWQDMMFTEATYPMTDDFVDAVEKETSQNARRLAYHPSLALIVTNDEIELFLTKGEAEFGKDAERLETEYKQLFMGTIVHVLNTISRNEFSPRPGPMTSTPSMGIEESKKHIMPNPQNINYGDYHFFELEKDGWDPETFAWARFISKYGFLSLPIMSSWNRTLSPTDTMMDMINHRQHYPEAFSNMLLLLQRHLPVPAEGWQHDMEAFIYLSQVSQAIAAKTATEVYRSRRVNNRTMGALYWQLNDIWVAPSWSSIDFYGNYKLLYYWSKEFLAPTTIIALYDAKNSAINVTMTREDVADNNDPRIYDVTMNTYMWSQLYPQRKITWQTILGSNGLRQRILPLNTVLVEPFNATNSFIEFVLSKADSFISRTYFFPSDITSAVGIMNPQLTFELSWHYCNVEVLSEERVNSYSITVYIRRPAIFVYFEVNHKSVINYKFSENGYVQVDPVKTIHLQFEQKSECLTLAPENIKVLTLNQFMLSSSGVPEEPEVPNTTPTIAETSEAPDIVLNQ